MATEIVHTIKASGGDYSSLSAWEAAQQRDLVSADEIAVAECYGFVDTSGAIIDGWTTDSTRYIEVRAAEEAKASVPWNDNGYRMVSAQYFAPISVRSEYVKIKNIQIENTRVNTGTGASSGAIQHWFPSSYGQNGSLEIDSCVFRRRVVDGYNSWGIQTGGYATHSILVRNTLIYGFAECFFGQHNAGIVSQSLFNNTFASINTRTIDCYSGGNSKVRFVAKNNILIAPFGSSMAVTPGLDMIVDIDTNASNITGSSSTGSNFLANRTFTFIDEANGDYRLAPTDTGARYSGLDLSTDPNYAFSTDFFGTTRITPWDLGVYEAGIVEKVSTIKSSGGDYSSLSAWEAAEQMDLVTSKSIAIAECYGFTDTDPVTINGWTTDQNCYIIVRPAPGAEAQVPYSTSSATYRIEDVVGAGNAVLWIQEAYTQIKNIQIKATPGGQASTFLYNAINVNGGTAAIGSVITGCHIVGDYTSWVSASTGCYGIYANPDIAGNLYIYNNVVDGFVYDSVYVSYGIRVVNHSSGKSYVYNNTVVNCGTCIRDGYSDMVIKNNLVIPTSSGTGYIGNFSAGTTNNASSDATTAGSNPFTNETFTFQNEATKDYRLSTFDVGASNKGVSLDADSFLPISVDFDGTYRRRAWDIGAFQNNEQQIKINPNGTNQISGVGVTTFIDEFNRANGLLGDEYQVFPASGSLEIFNNVVRGGLLQPSHSIAILTGSRFSPNQETTITFRGLKNFDFAGPVVRGNAEIGNGYVVVMDSTSTGNRLTRLTSGSTVVGLNTTDIDVQVGQQVTIRAVDNLISVYVDGQLITSASDSTFTVGQPGIYYRRENTRETYIDNFIATDIPPQGKTGQLMTITPT